MSIVYWLLPISLVFVAIFTIAFVKAVLSGQFDDLDTPATRALLDDSFQNENKEKMKWQP